MNNSFVLQAGILPACILQQAHAGELALSRQFAVDAFLMFRELPNEHGKTRRLAQEQIAVDLFSGVTSRETISRATTGAVAGHFDAATSFSIIALILLREWIPLTPARTPLINRPKHLQRALRQQLLTLLYSYGVQCADGSCCHLARDPIPVQAASFCVRRAV